MQTYYGVLNCYNYSQKTHANQHCANDSIFIELQDLANLKKNPILYILPSKE